MTLKEKILNLAINKQNSVNPMIKNSIKWIGVSAALTIFASCAVNEDLQEPAALTDVAEITEEGIFALTTDPDCGEAGQTKAIGTDLKFSFTSTDDISVYPSTGTTHMVYRLVPDADDAKKATFNSTEFDLQNDKTYYAFSPDVTNANGAGSVSVSFAGQAQTEDNSTAHLSAFDFQTAAATISNNSGTFGFKHKVSWLKMTITVSDAAVLKSVTVSADEGVANTAVFDLVNGTVTPSRQAGDKLTLTLGGEDGISVAASGSATAYITLPSQTYTDLTVVAVDANGKEYKKVYDGEKTLEAGKYYIPTLICNDINFLNQTAFGSYKSTDLATPAKVRVYDEDNDQMSYGTGSDYRNFKLANLSTNSYAIFTIASATLTEGQTYSVSSDVNGTISQADCEVVKITDDCVWLEDKTNNVGFILALE